MNPSSELRKAAQLEQRGQPAQAAALYRGVLARFPQREDAQLGLLSSLEALGDWTETETVARAITASSPGFVPAWLLLARVLLVRQQEALAVCQRCVKLDPRNPGAYDYLGIACRRAGRLDEAVAAFQASLRLRPGHLSTQSNLANALRDQGRLAEAAQLYRAVCKADPARTDAAHNLALTLCDLGEFTQAESELRQLLAAAPAFAEAHNALGTVLQALNRLAEAEVCFRRALALKPDLPDAISNLMLVLHGQSKQAELRAYLGRAVALMPDSSMLRLTDLVVALPKMASSAEEARASLCTFDAGLEAYGAWRRQALLNGSLRQDSLATVPFYLAYRLGNHRDRLARFADLSADGKTWPAVALPRSKAAGTRLRLGVVSAHVRRHSVWDIVLKGLVRHLDRERFELTIYHLGAIEDDETAFAKAAVDHWRDAGSLAGSTGWADLIARDGQDVLYYPEIGMNPVCYQLAQQRLAPLQAAGWGHPVTTGIAAMDLFISGELIEPAQAQAHYREQLVRLPGTGCCTTAFEVTAQSCGLPPEWWAPDAAPLFFIAQGVFKFDPAFDGLLVEIAQRIGACRFVIPVGEQLQEPAAQLAARLGAAFDDAGLDSERHLAFVPWMGEGAFRHALQVCTVFLDCPAFSGYTTAWKALHEGIPVVTWEGEFMRQRLAAGLLRRVGLEALVAGSAAAYVDLAVGLAQATPVERQSLRACIARAASQADEDVSVVRAFEAELQSRLAALR